MVISMLKIRRPLGRLIFNMGIAIPGKTVFLIETAPRASASTMLTILWLLWHVHHAALQIDWLVQERLNSRMLAMELHLSCINPSRCPVTAIKQTMFEKGLRSATGRFLCYWQIRLVTAIKSMFFQHPTPSMTWHVSAGDIQGLGLFWTCWI